MRTAIWVKSYPFKLSRPSISLVEKGGPVITCRAYIYSTWYVFKLLNATMKAGVHLGVAFLPIGAVTIRILGLIAAK